jgi:hypothetical protein
VASSSMCPMRRRLRYERPRLTLLARGSARTIRATPRRIEGGPPPQDGLRSLATTVGSSIPRSRFAGGVVGGHELLPMLSVEQARVQAGDIHAFQAAHVHADPIRLRPWRVERVYAAMPAERVLCNAGAKLVCGNCVSAAQQFELFAWHDHVHDALHRADRAVAHRHLIQIAADAKPHLAAVAAALIGCEHVMAPIASDFTLSRTTSARQNRCDDSRSVSDGRAASPDGDVTALPASRVPSPSPRELASYITGSRASPPIYSIPP